LSKKTFNGISLEIVNGLDHVGKIWYKPSNKIDFPNEGLYILLYGRRKKFLKNKNPSLVNTYAKTINNVTKQFFG
jgi:hypothetical protein